MNKRRLLKLADLLEADARKKRGVQFDLGVVIGIEKTPRDGKVKLNCGTQACAMGLAAISGAFKRHGLSYRIDDGRDEWGDRSVNVLTTFKGKGMYYDRAAMLVFDLKLAEADFLFTPSFYGDDDPIIGAIGERRVAQRIRDFVAGKVAP